MELQKCQFMIVLPKPAVSGLVVGQGGVVLDWPFVDPADTNMLPGHAVLIALQMLTHKSSHGGSVAFC